LPCLLPLGQGLGKGRIFDHAYLETIYYRHRATRRRV
jgi:hypothetical protein